MAGRFHTHSHALAEGPAPPPPVGRVLRAHLAEQEAGRGGVGWGWGGAWGWRSSSFVSLGPSSAPAPPVALPGAAHDGS